MHPYMDRLSVSAYYLRWGVVQISLTNFLIIIGMVLLFVAALLVPFPGSRQHQDAVDPPRAEDHDVSH